MGWVVKNYMSGQSKDALRVCNIKIRKSWLGPKRGTSLWLFRLAAPSVERFELFFSKMVKLEGKESPDPKLSDFEWFGEVFKIIMFNMFVWFYHIFLISDLNTCPILMYDHANWSLWPPLQEYEVILPPGAYKAPKTAKTCRKSPMSARFCHFKTPYRLSSGNITSYSCRGGHKLRFAWSYIKIRHVLRSEMRKMRSQLQMLISPKRHKISKFQVHIWNQQQILHLIDVVL